MLDVKPTITLRLPTYRRHLRRVQTFHLELESLLLNAKKASSPNPKARYNRTNFPRLQQQN